MSIVWLLKNFLASLLLPPANGLLLVTIAGIWRRRRWALPLATVGVLLLVAQSVDPIAGMLIEPLERRAGPVVKDAGGAQAIVVLGSGRSIDAPEYGGDTSSQLMLVRLRYGAVLAKRFSLPVLVSGGKTAGGTRTEAEIMAEILRDEFQVPVRWREDRSLDTAENAALSAPMLRQAGVTRVVLVTHAFHMLRARQVFERAGLEVVPAPTGFIARDGLPAAPHQWLPQASTLRVAEWALHEWIGLGWYALTGAS